MESQRKVAMRAACVPPGIVVAYVLAVLSRPEVRLGDVLPIAAGHLARNLNFLFLFLLVALLASRVEKREGRSELWHRAADFLRGRWRHDRLLSLGLPPLSLAILLASFTSFKQQVLPLAGFGMDPLFAEIDRALFLGVDPWRITHALIPSALGTRVIDVAYMLWFFPLMALMLMSGFAPLRLRTQFLIAFPLTWILAGTVLAFLLPSAGPCYYEAFHGRGDFEPLMARLRAQDAALAVGGGEGLLAVMGQQALLDSYNSRELMLAGGISAMPSMHNALAVLFACAGFAYKRPVGWALAVFAGVIGFGSVHLGWHYAIDGVVGGASGWLIWRVSGLLAAWLLEDRRPAVSPLSPDVATPIA